MDIQITKQWMESCSLKVIEKQAIGMTQEDYLSKVRYKDMPGIASFSCS